MWAAFYELRRDAASDNYEYRRMHSKPPESVFGQRLREARRRAGIAQDKLGVMVGLDEGTASTRISRYETGTHEPPVEFASKLAQVLQIPTAYLYCEDHELAVVILAWHRASQEVRRQVWAGLAAGE